MGWGLWLVLWELVVLLVLRRNRAGTDRAWILVVALLGFVHGVDVFLNLVHVDVGNGAVAVENASDLLECGTLGLDVEEPHKDKLDQIPKSVEEHKVPMTRQALPGELVGLAEDG